MNEHLSLVDELPLRFSTEGIPHSTWPLNPLFACIASALGLSPQARPMYTFSRFTSVRDPRPGEKFEGFARINKVRGATVDEHKIAMFSYSFMLYSQQSLLILSGDLNSSMPGGPVKPSEVWFREGELPVLLTPELKATVKALAPKKKRPE